MSQRALQPVAPCALCTRRIFGPHWRVYVVGGHGCDLVCQRCSRTQPRSEGERWYHVVRPPSRVAELVRAATERTRRLVGGAR